MSRDFLYSWANIIDIAPPREWPVIDTRVPSTWFLMYMGNFRFP